jgi:hypothetical protein
MIGAFVIVGAVMLVAPAAEASCLPAKLFSTWDFDDGVYFYVNNFSGDFTGTVGAFWETGNRALSNEGTYPVNEWLSYYAGYGWYLNGNMGDSRVTGCPATQMIVVVTEDGADGSLSNFIAGAANETPAKGNAFNYADLTFTPIPAPSVTGSTRLADNNVEVDLLIADPAAGYSTRDGIPATDVITAINIYTIKSNTRPTSNPADWTLAQSAAYAGGDTSVVGLVADCQDQGTDTWLGAGIEFGGEYSSELITVGNVVECDPALADPDDKFQLIQGKGKGQKKGKPFQR